MKEQLAHLPEYLAPHLALTLAALVVGVAISVPLGVLISRFHRLEQPILGVAGVIQTIPGLALLAFMIPALAAVGARSIGYFPALIGLCLYSLLPILRNTVAGLSTVDPALLEAARGVGMTPGEQLRRVELPLAMPVIVAGIRTAAVWTVGTATLSTPVGAPSLGNYIFSGLQTRNYDAILVGCAASAALALLLDGLMRAAEAGVLRRRRSLWITSVCAFGLLSALAVAPFARGGAEAPVRIGAESFTEQYILSRVLAGRITSETGLPVEVVDSLGSMVVFDALRSSEIDVEIAYSGTLWVSLPNHKDERKGRAEVLREVTDTLRTEYGVTVAAVLGFENTYMFAMRKPDAERLGIRRISDLVPHARSMSLGSDYILFERPEWRSIQEVYGLAVRETRSMDPSLMYDALKNGSVDVITAFSTDGRIVSYQLATLEDDRGAIPPYDALVLVSPRLAREPPEVVEAIRGLEGAIDVDLMRRMNAEVDEEKRSPAEVAERFLQGVIRKQR